MRLPEPTLCQCCGKEKAIPPSMGDVKIGPRCRAVIQAIVEADLRRKASRRKVVTC